MILSAARWRARPRLRVRRGLVALLVPLLAVAVTAGECRRNTGEEPPRPRQIFLTATGMQPLTAQDGFYELWLGSPAALPPAGTPAWEVPQNYVPAVAFLVDTLGVVTTPAGTPISSMPLPAGWDASGLARGIVTYQTPDQAGTAHGIGFKLAGGAFQVPGYIVTAELDAQDPEVTALDLTALAGEVTLATPTSANPEDELLGAWFYRGPIAAPEASLQLGAAAALPDSQIFEGWLLERSDFGRVLHHYSMGRFRSATGVDSDRGGPGAGPEPPLPFPGQDFFGQLPTGLPFLVNPEVMITLEPQPDPAPGLPSTLRVLRLGIPSNAPSHVAFALANSARTGALPHVTVTVQR